MDRICKHRQSLQHICYNAKCKKSRFSMLKGCSPEFIKAITDIVHNVLQGNIKVRNKKKLSKYKQTLRHIVKPSVSLANKRRVLIQKGGFLPFLAPLIPLLAAAAPIIAKGALGGLAATAASAAASKVFNR